MMSLSRWVFCFTEPKQALFSISAGRYQLITEYGKEEYFTEDQVLIYLFCDGEMEYKSIQESIFNNTGVSIQICEISDFVDYLMQVKLIRKRPLEEVIYHPHFSFNAIRVAKLLSDPANLGKIISLGKLEMSVTNQCPFKCTYCSKKHHQSLTPLSITNKKIIIKEAFDLGADTLTLTGGEPLMDQCIQETLELVRYASELGIKRKVILTSGYGVSKYAEALSSAGVDEIQISYNRIYSYSEDRVRNHFIERNIEGITNVKNYGIRLGVCAVLNSENVDKVQDIINFCSANRITSLYFYPVMPIGCGKQNWDKIKLNAVELKDIIAQILRLKHLYKNEMFISAPQSFLMEGKAPQICEGGLYMAYVTESGGLAACACAPVGVNMGETSFKYAWQNTSYLTNYRRVKQISTSCGSCELNKYCLNTCVLRQNASQQGYAYDYDNCLLSAANQEIR